MKLCQRFVSLVLLILFTQSLSFADSSSTAINDSQFGMCPANFAGEDGDAELFTSYKTLRTAILNYRVFQEKTLAENRPRLTKEFHVPLNILLFLRNMHTLKPLFDRLKLLLLDKDFASLKSNPVFSAAMANTSFLRFISQLDLSAASDSKYKAFMESIQSVLKLDGMMYALNATAMDSVDLSQMAVIDDTLALIKFFEGTRIADMQPWISSYRTIAKDKSIEAAELQKIPLMITLPYPAKLKGMVADNYRELFQKEMTDFLLTSKDKAVAEQFEFFSNEFARSFNTYTFDTQIPVLFSDFQNDSFAIDYKKYQDRTVSKSELIAIDGLARTIYGEVNTCEANGIEQATLIGKIIADRAEAVRLSERRQKQNLDSLDHKIATAKKMFESNFVVTALDFTKALSLVTLKSVYGGKSDFGRSDIFEKVSEKQVELIQRNLELSHPVTQVVSRGDQFSGWRSASKKKITVSAAHANLPSIVIVLNQELNEGDISALYNQLCPKTDTDRWKRMLSIAKAVVLEDSKSFSDLIKWKDKISQTPLFYTHGVDLDFVDRVGQLPTLIDSRDEEQRMTKNLTVQYQKTGPGCSQIKLWNSRNVNRYFPVPGNPLDTANQ